MISNVVLLSVLALCQVVVSLSLETSLTDVSIIAMSPLYFNLTPSEAIGDFGAWYWNVPLVFECSNVTVGPANPELCVDKVEVAMQSSSFGNATASFDAGQLEELRSIEVGSNRSAYVYGLPLSEYAKPNALYERAEILLLSTDDTVLGNIPIPTPVIYNYYNASAASLRKYYGVPPEVQGNELVRQSSTLTPGTVFAAVNASAVAEYLELQGLVPNVPLQVRDQPPNNVVQYCIDVPDNGSCGEAMLDVQAQQAFAPQAITFFTPASVPIAQLEAQAAEYLMGRGYPAKEISKEIERVGPALLQGSFNETTSSGNSSLDDDLSEFYNSFMERYFIDFVRNVTTRAEPIQVASLSWTNLYPVSPEVLEEGLKNLTMRGGISLLVASGDGGASGVPGSDDCLPEDGPLVGNQAGYWPVVSPWVTTVGGTQFLATEQSPEGTEVVCSGLSNGGVTSSGGFAGPAYPASLYSMPAWQKKFAERYLSENNATTFAGFPSKDTPGFNPTGRAFPDIAMYAAWFPVLDEQGAMSPSSGTSLAAPMAAAMFTLANQQLLADGYEVIGYANPMIYWMGENCTEAFQDITVGNNKAGEDGGNCLYGFPAAPGWDPATGFGSIKFDPFVTCAKRYQDEVRSKGLEILPDGTLNTAAATPGGGGDKPGSSASGFCLPSLMLAASIAMLAALA